VLQAQEFCSALNSIDERREISKKTSGSNEQNLEQRNCKGHCSPNNKPLKRLPKTREGHERAAAANAFVAEQHSSTQLPGLWQACPLKSFSDVRQSQDRKFCALEISCAPEACIYIRNCLFARRSVAGPSPEPPHLLDPGLLMNGSPVFRLMTSQRTF
jgi:hypothetical protein